MHKMPTRDLLTSVEGLACVPGTLNAAIAPLLFDKLALIRMALIRMERLNSLKNSF